MNGQYWILVAVWVLSVALLLYIPKSKRRVALVAFLFKQNITYLLGLVAVELNLLAYPVREFATINHTSLTYEYMAYPTVCAVFNAFYPAKRSLGFRVAYFAAYCNTLTLTEALLEHYTNLVMYIKWEWWWTWLSLLATFFMTRLFCRLFFKELLKHSNHAKAE